MFRNSYFLLFALLLSPVLGFSREAPDVNCPASTTVPALAAGFDLLYEQKFAEARQAFLNWESQVPTKIGAPKE